MFTPDLERMAEWLERCRVNSVAIEATGVYWIPVMEILEARGIEVILVNARHVKNVPGRKSDVQDCEWLRQLHTFGLLRGSFRPADSMVALRGFVRHRVTLVESASTTIQRIQKALVQMNLQLHLVIADIMGMTGQLILRDIAAGRTNPHELARHRDPRCRASEAEIVSALTGNYRPEHVFVLKQNLEIFDELTRLIAACDRAIEEQLQGLVARVDPVVDPLPKSRTREKRQGNEPAFEVRKYLYHLTGADLTQIDGIGPYVALRLISEIGIDMSRWKSEKHFTAWLALAPQNKISGGRLLSSRTAPSANRAAAILRIAAMAAGKTDTALGGFYRRLGGRIGKAKAITATARKLALLVYRTLKGGFAYQDPGAAAYDAQQRTRVLRRLKKHAHLMGFGLVDLQTGEVVAGAVS